MRFTPLIAKRWRQFGALVLLAVALALPTVLVALPVWARHQQLAEDVSTARMRLGRLQAAIEYERSFLKSETAPVAPAGVFLGSGNDAALLAALQSRLVAMATTQSVRVLSSTQLPSRDENGFRAGGVRINFRDALEHVQLLLHSIEASRPLMFVEVAEFRADWSAAPSGRQAAPVIDAVLDVFAIAEPVGMSKDQGP